MSDQLTPPPPPETTEKPKLTWYQYLWISWPIVLVGIGGAIGGACGGAAMGLNLSVFRSTKHPVLRYLWTGLISIGAVILYIVGVTVFLVLTKKTS